MWDPMPKPHRPHHSIRRSAARFSLLFAFVLTLLVSGAAGAGWRHDSQPPTVPANLRVTAATASSVAVGWDASTDNNGVAGYFVSSGTQLDKLRPSTLTDTLSALTCGSTSIASVVAYDRAGNQSAPATTTVSTAPCADAQPPSPPSNLVVATRTQTGVSISWSPSSDNVGVVGYGVHNGTALVTTSSTSATVAGLSCGSTVTLGVDAFDASGNRSTQTMISAATLACPDATPPSAPSGLATSNVTQTGATLSWTASTDDVGVAGYGVYQGSAGPDTATQTSYTLTGLACGTDYSLAVDAFDAAGNRSAKTQTSLTTAACSVPVPPSGTEPAPIAGQGYHLAFADDFNSLNRSTWDDHIWYDDAPNPAWKNFQYVQDGVLHLVTSRSFFWGSGASDNYPINTMTTQSSGLTFQQGYFEARMQSTKGDGAWPGFWLYSYRHATNPSWPSVNPFCQNNGLAVAQCYSGELDIFEGQGSEPQAFYGTVHRNSCGCYGVADDQNGNNWQPTNVDLTSGFHTYGMLWTPSQITWYLDGKALMSAPTYDSTNQPMFLLLQMWVGGWTKNINSTTPTNIETDVDYVHVWQK